MHRDDGATHRVWDNGVSRLLIAQHRQLPRSHLLREVAHPPGPTGFRDPDHHRSVTSFLPRFVLDEQLSPRLEPICSRDQLVDGADSFRERFLERADPLRGHPIESANTLRGLSTSDRIDARASRRFIVNEVNMTVHFGFKH